MKTQIQNLDTEMFVFVFTLFLIRLLYSTDISSSAVHASSRIVTKAYGVYMFITMKIICMYPLSTFKTKSCEICYRKKGSSLKFKYLNNNRLIYWMSPTFFSTNVLV